MNRYVRSALAALLIVIVSACAGGGPGDAVREFSRDVEAGRLDEAMNRLSSSTRGMIGDDKLRAALQHGTRQASEKGGIEQLEILEESIQGQTAEVRVRTTYGNGETETETIPLVMEDGEWKVEIDK